MRLFILLFSISLSATAQEIPIVQHSSFCEGNAGLGGPGTYKERIKEEGRREDGHYAFAAILVRDCQLPIFPLNAIKRNDTLFVTTSLVETATFDLSNGMKISRRYSEEECRCAYEFRMELVLDTISVISIDRRVLERTDEKFMTYPVRYFIFNDDTTGYEDKYGVRQGYYIIKRKDNLLKVLYKDGVEVGCELLTLDGKLIAKVKDCYSFIGKTKK